MEAQKHPKIDSGIPPGHLIAYVHEVTPLKRNRSNTLDYFKVYLFKDVLEKMIGLIEGVHDDVILQKLLVLENFQLSYNNQQVVKDVTI